jgi:DNA-binding transcriptional ArsR family regulator
VQTYHHAQLNALGDATRRAILASLLNGPKPVVTIARQFTISRPAISQHLRVLKEAHLVTDVPSGNKRLYQLNPDGFDALRQFCDHFWTHALAAFKARVEEK